MAICKEVMELRRKELGPTHPKTIETQNEYANKVSYVQGNKKLAAKIREGG